MKIAVSGSSGLIGSGLVSRLRSSGHQVLRLVRSAQAPTEDTVNWQPQAGTLDAGALEGADLVVHLAGENIAGFWTRAKKRRIRDSRVLGTRTLSEALSQLKQPPSCLLCASAIGYYGNRADEVLTETSPAGNTFLAEVCHDWEAATSPAANRGIRVVNLRFGVVLSKNGGALRQMLRPFRLGLGGVMGSGNQYMSWVSLPDALRAIEFAAHESTLRGPVNVTAPHPVSNAEFTRALGRALRRPTFLPIPAGPLKLMLGQMAQEMLLSSARVFPQRLQGAGFRFDHEDIDEALREVLN